MKIVSRTLFVALLLVFSSGLAAAAGEPPVAGAAASTGGPVVQLPETSFDFGEMYDGKEYLHEFIVKNVGNATLQIKKVMPG